MRLGIWLVATLMEDQQVALFCACWMALLGPWELVRREAAPDYYRASPAIMFLAHEAPLTAAVAGDFQQKVRELSVGYVVIHPGMMDPAWVKETMALVAGLDGVHRLDAGAGVIAFRVD